MFMPKQCYRIRLLHQPLGIKFKCEFKTKDKRLTMPKSKRFLSCTKHWKESIFKGVVVYDAVFGEYF